MRIFNSLCIFVATIWISAALKVKVEDKSLFRVVPRDEDELWLLKQFSKSNYEVILWSGIGQIGEPVEFLAVPAAMEKFTQDLNSKSKLNIGVELVFPYVKIEMGTKPITGEPDANNCTKLAPKNNPVPVQKIPGTNLFTGIYYTVKMPRFPEGFVTWTEATNDHDANFIQIDLNPNNLPHYRPGEKWDKDAQWMFRPTEDPDWFQWDNRVLSSQRNAVTTWSYKEVGSGNHIIASKKPDDIAKLSAGGEWRVHALWKPIPVPDSNRYKLINKNFPMGTITWTEQKYGNHSHYIQVDTDIEHWEHYRIGEKWDLDAQFEFIQAEEIVLSATISNFSFSPSYVDYLRDDYTLMVNYTLNNPTSVEYSHIVEQSFERLVNASYKFEIDSNFKVHLENVTIENGLPPLFGEVNVTETFKLDEQPRDHMNVDIVTFTVLKASKPITIPKHSSIRVSSYPEWLNQPETSFNATMQIIGKTSSGAPLSGLFIRNHLIKLDQWSETWGLEEYGVSIGMEGLFKGNFTAKGAISVGQAKPRWNNLVKADTCLEKNYEENTHSPEMA